MERWQLHSQKYDWNTRYMNISYKTLTSQNMTYSVVRVRPYHQNAVMWTCLTNCTCTHSMKLEVSCANKIQDALLTRKCSLDEASTVAWFLHWSSKMYKILGAQKCTYSGFSTSFSQLLAYFCVKRALNQYTTGCITRLKIHRTFLLRQWFSAKHMVDWQMTAGQGK